MNKTKIITTVGPASEKKEILKNLILAGTNVFRFNLSHASYEFCEKIIAIIRELNKELNTNVGIMLDTNGPNVRIGKLINDKAVLAKGTRIRIYMDAIIGDETKFSVNYPKLIDDVKYGTEILLNDGFIKLEVVDKELNYILCEVITGGTIESNQSLNVPNVKVNIPFLSTKDKDDILFAHKVDADFLALSFVSSSEDVLMVNDLLIELGNDQISIISKIERSSAIEEIDDIIRVSDGIMVARGDLGVEIPMERIPSVQKSIINKCHIEGKVSVVATEFLSSMETEVRPSRAEVSDVANAVIDGTDAVMLAGETTIGKYPVETVEMMSKIIKTAEEDINYFELLDKAMRSEKQDVTGSLVYSVTECANRLKCKAIVTPTISGYTARKMSRFRPSCPILALTPNDSVARTLSLNYGVYTVINKKIKNFDKMLEESKDSARTILSLSEKDKIIITGGYPFEEVKHTNFMKIDEI